MSGCGGGEWHSLACHGKLSSSHSCVTLHISQAADSAVSWAAQGREESVDLGAGRQAVRCWASRLASRSLAPSCPSNGLLWTECLYLPQIHRVKP